MIERMRHAYQLIRVKYTQNFKKNSQIKVLIRILVHFFFQNLIDQVDGIGCVESEMAIESDWRFLRQFLKNSKKF